MSKKKKYYTVWQGHQSGVYKSWEECKAQIHGFEGAVYKSFPTLEMAQEALENNPKKFIGKPVPFVSQLSEEQLKLIGQPNYNSIAVDAASSGNPGKMEYRGVETKTKKELFKQGPFKQGTSNVGEFLALVHGLAFLKQHHSNHIIYSDSKIAIGWIKKKKCNTKLQLTDENKNLFELIKRAEHWLKTNTFQTTIVKWETKAWGEIPADFGRK